MKNKWMILFLFTSLYFFLSCQGVQTEKINQISNRPNIIFILADDLGYGDLGVTGQTKIETPNIDKLAGEGNVFYQSLYRDNCLCTITVSFDDRFAYRAYSD
jgi:arylsulfatase A